jgi:formate hydrogenlyase subunit 6/NADH:ubiquinone oxidoreductase subunit I
MAIVVHDDRSEISARCTACGTCERFCPVAAIHKTAEAAS